MKSERYAKIIELIQNQEVETQDELSQLLTKAGYKVTQATVSRDIHALKLTKVPSASGGHKYAASTSLDSQDTGRLNRVFRDGLVSMDYAGNILVIHTFNGMAMAVAAALDAMRLPAILGTIAGDDVILCVVRSENQAAELMVKLKN